MTLLKLKARFYKLTGIYLAHEEENDYLCSPEFWEEHQRFLDSNANDWLPRDVQGVLIGSWQARHGFARAWKRK